MTKGVVDGEYIKVGRLEVECKAKDARPYHSYTFVLRPQSPSSIPPLDQPITSGLLQFARGNMFAPMLIQSDGFMNPQDMMYTTTDLPTSIYPEVPTNGIVTPYKFPTTVVEAPVAMMTSMSLPLRIKTNFWMPAFQTRAIHDNYSERLALSPKERPTMFAGTHYSDAMALSPIIGRPLLSRDEESNNGAALPPRKVYNRRNGQPFKKSAEELHALRVKRWHKAQNTINVVVTPPKQTARIKQRIRATPKERARQIKERAQRDQSPEVRIANVSPEPEVAHIRTKTLRFSALLQMEQDAARDEMREQQAARVRTKALHTAISLQVEEDEAQDDEGELLRISAAIEVLLRKKENARKLQRESRREPSPASSEASASSVDEEPVTRRRIQRSTKGINISENMSGPRGEMKSSEEDVPMIGMRVTRSASEKVSKKAQPLRKSGRRRSTVSYAGQ